MHAMNGYRIASVIVTDLCRILEVKVAHNTDLKVSDTSVKSGKLSTFEQRKKSKDHSYYVRWLLLSLKSGSQKKGMWLIAPISEFFFLFSYKRDKYRTMTSPIV